MSRSREPLGALGDDVVGLEQLDLIARRAAVPAASSRKRACSTRELERERHQHAATVDHPQHILHQLGEAVDLRPTKFEGLARRVVTLQGGDDRRGHVADVDRLETGPPAADQGQHGRQPGHGGEAVEEAVLGADHDARPHDGRSRQRLARPRLALRLAAGIGAARAGIGTDRRHLDQPLEARLGRRSGDSPGQFALHLLELAPPPLVQDADQVDRGEGAVQHAPERLLAGEIGPLDDDLADMAHRLEVAAARRVTTDHQDPSAARRRAGARDGGQ